MTPEERKDYNKLTAECKKYYDLYQGMHPEWGHAQLMTMAIICCNKPFTPNPDPITDIIKKANKFMEENFPELYPKVKKFFYNIGQAIKKAVQVTRALKKSLSRAIF